MERVPRLCGPARLTCQGSVSLVEVALGLVDTLAVLPSVMAMMRCVTGSVRPGGTNVMMSPTCELVDRHQSRVDDRALADRAGHGPADDHVALVAQQSRHDDQQDADDQRRGAQAGGSRCTRNVSRCDAPVIVGPNVLVAPCMALVASVPLKVSVKR